MSEKKIKTKVVGVTFANPDGSSRQAHIKQHARQGDPVFLLPHPIPEDKNAVGVHIRQRRGCLAIGRPKTAQIGHLGREMAQELHQAIVEGRVSGHILQVTGGDGKTLGVNIELIVK